ncbi:meteorin-like protein isoform X1 [Astyanax mexicanus]|uniref:meteorin-like protein isoform X1 n=1 Tax=Astyanax mexicanus TaxID=7994 RepID=UPI0020CB21D4|nr:meteorin-like protein isoform X1 [Astyanax mexicanus]
MYNLVSDYSKTRVQIEMSHKGIGILQFWGSLCFLWFCTADMCSWTGSCVFGSGLVRDPLSGPVQQVRLRCSAGSVRWLFPCLALRLLLNPNVASSRPAALCIKATRASRGAAVYVERAGELELLMEDGGRPEQVHCISTDGAQGAAVFLQANPQSDYRRRAVGFRYELLQEKSTTSRAACRPCNDSEILQAICSSDFVVRGSIRNVSHHPERQTSVIEVVEAQVYRQRSGVFEREPVVSGHWHGHIRTPLQCHVKAGPGQFLFTGDEHFGEALLSCAPRFRDFIKLYHSASASQNIPCDFSIH